MSFVFPQFLWALAALAPLVACYFFVGRVRPQQVSSLFLWHLADVVPRAGAKPKQFDRNWLLPLEILILVLLVLAAAGPRRLSADDNPLLAVILDDSFSMQAEGVNGSARQRALTALADLLREESYRAVYFIAAGETPRLLDLEPHLFTATGASTRVASAWPCRASDADLAAALALARRIGGERARFLILSDHAADPPLETNVRHLSFGAPVANRAFANAVRADNGESAEILFEVMQNGDGGAFELELDDGQIKRIRLEGEPGELIAHRLTVNGNAPSIRLTLPQDGLAADNQVQLLRAPQRQIRVALRLDDKNLQATVARALKATDSVQLSAENPHLVISAADQAPAFGAAAWRLQIERPSHARVYQGPFVMDRGHAITEGLNLAGSLWAAGTTNVPGRPLITVGNVVLLGHEPVGASQHFFLQIDPDIGNLDQSPNWPILFDNLVRLRRAQLPGTAVVNARIGQPVTWRVASDTETLVLHHEDGERQDLPPKTATLDLPTSRPGRYRVEATTRDGVRAETALAVNLMRREESDLRRAATGAWGTWSPTTTDLTEADLTPWLLAAALLLLALHLVLSRRQVEVAA